MNYIFFTLKQYLPLPWFLTEVIIFKSNNILRNFEAPDGEIFIMALLQSYQNNSFVISHYINL